MSDDLTLLREAVLSDPDGLLDRWVEQVLRRTWQLEGRRSELLQLRERCRAIVGALRLTFEEEPETRLGAPEWREPLQLLSFTGGWLAGAGLPVTAALSLSHGLRDASAGTGSQIYDDLATAVSEAYAAGMTQQALVQHRNVIEKSQVVCLLGDRLPCLFLVGDPDRQALDDAIGRLMMLAVMRQAEAMVVDASGLVNIDLALPEALVILADHRSEPPPRLVLTSVTAAMADRLERLEHPAGMVTHDRLEHALAELRSPSPPLG